MAFSFPWTAAMAFPADFSVDDRVLDTDKEYSDDVSRQLFALALPEEEISQHGLERFMHMHRQRHYKTLYFSKSRDWSQEFEFRWIAIGQDDKHALDPRSAEARPDPPFDLAAAGLRHATLPGR